MKTLDRINIKYFKYACPDLGKETDVDISAKCILCGDSETNSKQKRLHLYTKSSYDHDMINCFNCGFTGGMYKFLSQPQVDSYLLEQYKKETREMSFNTLKAKYVKKEFNNAEITLGASKQKSSKKSRAIQETPENRSDLSGEIPRRSKYNISMSGFEGDISESPNVERSGNDGSYTPNERDVPGSNVENISRDDVTKENVKLLGKIPDGVFELPLEFMPASESSDATNYLQSRGLDEKLYYFSKNWVKIKGKDIPVKNCIITPLWVIEDERIVYGFQARSIETKFFYTYIPEENTGFKVWNWYGIDKSKPTFIFESAFDAESSGLPLNRVCAALGADLNNERISELSEAIFCLDNQIHDQTSRVKTTNLLKRGFRCFIWDKSIPYKDTNDCIRGSFSKKTMAKYILSHIESGMTGIMKVKLKR